MKDHIQIVNWLLTRKCNLNCSYCRIVENYIGSPSKYPKISHYHQKEMSTEYVIETLKKIKLHNPNAFQIFYGGEPTLRRDLADIINFCNKENIHYTIITNNSDEVQPLIKKLLEKVDYVQGLTSSIDPMILDKSIDKNTDRYKKCVSGLERLQKYKDKIKDLVAEVTVDNQSIDYLYDLIKMLTSMGISSSITTIDVAKNKYYDFSNITVMNNLVHKTNKVKIIFNKIIKDKLNVHMGETLLPKLWDILPSNLDCGLEKNVHNMTIDADGSLRICLRIRGILTPNIKAYDSIMSNGKLHYSYKEFLRIDKNNYCLGCNWTCMEMSRMISEEHDSHDNLIHKEVRDG